ncbi:YdaU family protein [Gluconobacter wancherniae]|uniref:YdaU family protein n=1 Tax=Gluconobacter wancherniae TaxID=1307955 RepID=UPI001B8D6F09|nr:DUF1376 domain-containing protein [Gluconobacter wancherniae]MBS1093851.1 DUF1376 domain-containing protein [Gluconobacter wancherniae]
MSARKKSDTWMPIFIGDYLADTMRLSTIQHGAYLLLLMEYWRQGPLVDDMDELCAVCRTDRKTWDKTIWPSLSRFFEKKDDGLLHQKRADNERANAAEKKVKRSEAANARWGKKECKDDANASGMHEQSTCKGDDTQSSPLPSSLRSETSLTSFESERAQNPKSEKSKRACRLPADWRPSPEMAEFARSNGVDPERTAAVFRDYWVGVPDPKGRKADWSATWRNWVRREDGMQPNPQRTAPSDRRAAVNAAWAGVPDIEGV